MARARSERLGRGGSRPLKGLSNESRPDGLSPGEFCDLVNIDFSDDAIGRRGGFLRKAGPHGQDGDLRCVRQVVNNR